MAQSQAVSGDRDDGESITPPEMYYVATTLGEQEWLDGHDILLSAGTAWKNPGKSGANEGFDITVPESEQLFIDSGGFQATAHFGCEYPYDDSDLFVWAEDLGADYVAGMDFACERAEILAENIEAADADTIPSIGERIERTIDKQIEQYALYSELADRDGGWSFEFVPVVQGYSVEQYRYCAERLKEAGVATDYMAIGSVCKRDSPDKILDVLDACKDVLPGTEFHLFGATRRVWSDSRFWGAFRSSDTHAWAVSHPDGGWPSNNAEKAEAFAHYRSRIRSLTEAMVEQSAVTDSTNRRDKCAQSLPGTLYDGQCSFCDTEIPIYGINFSPGCTACERIKRDRTLYATGRVAAELSAADQRKHQEDGGSQSSLTDGDWTQTETAAVAQLD